MDQRSLVLGPLITNYLPLLVARADYERRVPILAGELSALGRRCEVRTVVDWLASTFIAHWETISVRVTVTLSSSTLTSWELCTDAVAIVRGKSIVSDSF